MSNANLYSKLFVQSQDGLNVLLQEYDSEELKWENVYSCFKGVSSKGIESETMLIVFLMNCQYLKRYMYTSTTIGLHGLQH